MPRPRFDKLPPARQNALLEAAALEFGSLGFDDASINHILERAGVSKGAAYYYFDDKEDLFLTVVRHYLGELGIDQAAELPESVTPETFWSTLTDLYRTPFRRAHDMPAAFGVWRAAGELFRTRTSGPLADFLNEQVDILRRLLAHGQRLGVIRTDLPDDLLMAWVRAVDDANDRWILSHWDELDGDALEAAADRVIDGIRRLLSPPGGAA
ncbi:MAG TPA: TetR/AcrR family transcriptional regulator [Chloroflexota bacterium]